MSASLRLVLFVVWMFVILGFGLLAMPDLDQMHQAELAKANIGGN